MKIKVKNSDVVKWLEPSLIVSVTGAQRDYPDSGNITLTVSDEGLSSSANNGNVAILTNPIDDNLLVIEKGEVTLKSEDLKSSLLSFSSEENIFLELVKNEFSITLEKDSDEKMTLPIENRKVVVPEQANKFKKEVKMKKDIFIRLMNKVSFAMGYEDGRPEFFYWMLRLNSNKARSVCGNGKRFTVYEIEGNGLFDVSKDVNILIHKDHNNVLDKLLPLSVADNINLQEYIRADDNDPYLNQTVLNLGNFTLMLVGHTPGIKWVDESVFLNRKNSSKFITSVNDWDGAIKSIKASNTKEVKKQNQYHWSTLHFDTANSVVNVNSSVVMKANRKVKLTDGLGDITFKCLSKYLVEAIDNADDSTHIQFEFMDNVSPVVIKYYASTKINDGSLEKTNISSGIKETHTFFFAAFNKSN
jgi:DNA polymerase III sliding clamp (beta) subunit (PCNA family)